MLNRLRFQGHFPRMENIAAFKPVSTSPPRSTCGVPERSSYCQSPSSQTELTTCYQAFCVQECPYRSSTPPYAPLLLATHRYVGFGMWQILETDMQNFLRPLWETNINIFKLYSSRGLCVTEDSNDTRPGTQIGITTSSERGSGGSSSVLFHSVQDGCLVSPPSQKLGALGSLTLALWIKLKSAGEMWV